jgi:predicted metal-binding membrane protein
MAVLQARRSPTPATVFVLLVGASLVAWIVTIERMQGMDAGPGTDLGGLARFVGIWVTMMAAMMFPSVVPMALAFTRATEARSARGQSALVPTWVFLAGYLAAWTMYGLVAYALFRVVAGLDGGLLAWDRTGPYVAGGAVIAAGIYELTRLKDRCLRHCRTPLHFFLRSWRDGRVGALRMGARHGAYCIGCCWGLMVVLFALGVMSLFWMAVVAAAIFAEKVLPRGDRVRLALAAGFVVLGLWLALGEVPGVTDPSGPEPSMQMP